MRSGGALPVKSSATPPGESRRARLRAGVERVVFLLLSGAIVGISSERMFWYWTPNPLDHWVVALYYGLAVAAVLWVIQKYRVNSLTTVMLAAPVFAYMVEGVITPILYEGGPFVPFFPAWFTFWHGFMSLVGLWYLLHLWLVQGRTRTIAMASAGMGLFWGMWSITMLLPENYEDPDIVADLGRPLELLDPAAFTRYVVSFSLMLGVMHWLWGRVVKPMSFEPSKWGKRIYVVGVGAILVYWTVIIPWALPMFLAYVALQIWILRRHAENATGPMLLEQLSGRVRFRHLLALVPMPLLASAAYGLLWELAPPLELIEIFMFTVIFTQFAIGLFLMVMLAWRTLKANPRPNPSPEAHLVKDPVGPRPPDFDELHR